MFGDNGGILANAENSASLPVYFILVTCLKLTSLNYFI